MQPSFLLRASVSLHPGEVRAVGVIASVAPERSTS